MMIVYVLSYTKPNGKSPMIADNDNGRFLPFIPREFLRSRINNKITFAIGIYKRKQIIMKMSTYIP